MLLLGGTERVWLFRFNGPDVPMDMLPGTVSQFIQELRALLA
mgnify:CR=1 FL=1